MRAFWATLGLGFLCLWLPAPAVQAQLEVSPPSDLPVAILPKAPEDQKKPQASNPTPPIASAPQSKARPRLQAAVKPNKTGQAVALEKKKSKTSRPLTLVKADRPGRGKAGQPRDQKRTKAATKKAAREKP